MCATLPGEDYSSLKSSTTRSVLQVHAGSFCVSVIHRTLTWTTGSLTCVSDHFVHIHTGVGLNDESAHIFDSEKLTSFCCAPGGVQTRVLESIGSWVQRSTSWATLSPLATLFFSPFHSHQKCVCTCILPWRHLFSWFKYIIGSATVTDCFFDIKSL